MHASQGCLEENPDNGVEPETAAQHARPGLRRFLTKRWRRNLLLVVAADLVWGAALALIVVTTPAREASPPIAGAGDRQVVADLCLDAGPAGVVLARAEGESPVRYLYVDGCWTRLGN